MCTCTTAASPLQVQVAQCGGGCVDNGRTVVEGEAMLALGAQLRYRTGGEGEERGRTKEEKRAVNLNM